MAVMHTNGQIILTGKEGKSFSQKMKSSDSSISRKRDAFIREACASHMVSHKSDGRIVLKGK